MRFMKFGGVEDFQPLQKVGSIFHLFASLFYKKTSCLCVFVPSC